MFLLVNLIVSIASDICVIMLYYKPLLCYSFFVSLHQQIQEDQLSAVVDWLTAQPRAAQLVDKDSSVVSTLEYHLGHYLKDVKRHYVKADKR